ncbi:mandelate racemase/muconate lactonizing enzyme family protein [Acidicapsa acidisoli]|uniref:mandelate racemase/muconate lactonizing enzyme family protein n=1 Tax=Acidicapsa acidisoli TaxID=1615681 RepID=UPI0021DFD0B3|nr:mandelate racemase/muconate lactonizing enzyme family protein [Acidicapsa acidisoli]
MPIHRRSLLQGLALVPLASAAGIPVYSQSKLPKLTVQDVEVFRVKVNKRGNWTIARLQTSGGVTGLGDASQSGKDDQTLIYIKQFVNLLRGQSIFAVEWFRKVTVPAIAQYGRPAAVAASALEQCLWDIQGKAFSVPTYDLFGGRIQDRIRLYANINRSTEERTPDGFARMAEKATAASFDAVKLAPWDEMPIGLTDKDQIEQFLARGIACGAAVRDAIGPKRDLLMDVHSRCSLEDGLDLTRRLDPLKLFWLEEVTPAKPVENLAQINKAAKMQTAGGESIVGIEGFYPYIKAEAVGIVMPDVKVCGGMLELKKIAAMAEGAGLIASPHGPASPVGNLTAAHVVATVSNFNILEFSYGEVPWRSELIDPPEQVVDGALALSNRPGLGVVLNERTAANYAIS